MPRLSDFPQGGTLFIDANIFLEHLLTAHPVCTAFFQRLQSREISGVTSIGVLAEVRHRLLLTEVMRHGWVRQAQRALQVVQERPELLGRLSACDAGLNELLEIPLRIVSLTLAQFRLAQRLSLRHHLLTNDALHLAVIRLRRLRHLASADKDFRQIPRLTVWTI